MKIIVNIERLIMIIMANVAITDECRKKLAYITLPDEYLRDCIERLVDSEIKRQGIKVPA